MYSAWKMHGTTVNFYKRPSLRRSYTSFLLVCQLKEEPYDVPLSFDFDPPPSRLRIWVSLFSLWKKINVNLNFLIASDQAIAVASGINLVALLHCNTLSSGRQPTRLLQIN